ncbi:uncharacterized protein LOC101237126 isoform X2 [Hydra vulgaris]|uniref:uncharacterized protein LOC101237126 isoform X2 n=1 Tax=Hydra vulgaris TaxID=6087 RepID=UPI001F5F71BF|nr:uncharacterized protein LOC101237126 isoform X2 [Hydra vulgaris]
MWLNYYSWINVMFPSLFLYDYVDTVYELLATKTMKYGDLLATLKLLPTEYIITFELYLTDNSIAYTNIIHFTANLWYGKLEDRIPAIFLSQKCIQVSTPVNNNAFSFYTGVLNVKKWINVTLSQLLVSQKYIHTFQLDDKIIGTASGINAKSFQNVKIYASNGYNPSQPGYIRNLVITNVCKVTDVNCQPLLDVILNGTLLETILNITLQINYAYESGEQAVGVTWEFILPFFLQLQSEPITEDYIRVNSSNLMFMIPNVLKFAGVKSVITTVLNASCATNTQSSIIEIQVKLYFQNAAGHIWTKNKSMELDIFKSCKFFRTFQTDVYQLDYQIESFVIKEEIVPKMNTFLQTLRMLPKEYEISFEVYLTLFYNSIISSLLQFTIGDKSLAFFVRTEKLEVCSAFNDSSIYCVLSQPLKLFDWNKVTVSQFSFLGNYHCTVKINNKTIATVINIGAQVFENVKIYASNNWHASQPAYIKKLIVTNACAVTDLYCKPLLNVTLNGTVFKNFWNLELKVSYAYEPGELAVNITWIYFLPLYLKLEFESTSEDCIKVNSNYLQYMIPNSLKSIGFIQSINTTFLDNSCEFGTHLIEIPVEFEFKNSYGVSWTSFHSVKNNIAEFCKRLSWKKSFKDIRLNEYYGRGIYWDYVSFHLYLCINQQVTSTKKACYYTNDNGVLWAGMDIRIGSVLGHHNETRELYAIHKNQKVYMMFHNTYKKWLAVTVNEFQTKISSHINWKLLKTLEKDYDQILTFGSNQWMGNSDGLYFRNSTKNIWIQKN